MANTLVPGGPSRSGGGSRPTGNPVVPGGPSRGGGKPRPSTMTKPYTKKPKKK